MGANKETMGGLGAGLSPSDFEQGFLNQMPDKARIGLLDKLRLWQQMNGGEMMDRLKTIQGLRAGGLGGLLGMILKHRSG